MEGVGLKALKPIQMQALPLPCATTSSLLDFLLSPCLQ